MAIETFLIALLATGATDTGAPDCAALETNQPVLREVLQASHALRAGAAKPGASFSQLVAQAKALAANGKAHLTELQAAGCRASEADLKALESCTAPLQWSCESVPPDVDWGFLASVKRAEDEDLAFALGDMVLNGAINVFAICCGDFGCREGGVGIPGSFYRDQTVAKLTRLAGYKSSLGRTALETLRKSRDGLEQAACSCNKPSAKDLATVSSLFAAGAKTTAPEAATAAAAVSGALAKGLPKKRCELPGGG